MYLEIPMLAKKTHPKKDTKKDRKNDTHLNTYQLH